MKLEQLPHIAAVKEHRFIANMIAMTIRDNCGWVGVEIAEPQAQPPKIARKPKSRK